MIVIRNASHLIKDSEHTLSNVDILIKDGIIAEIGENIDAPGAKEIDAKRCIVAPGFHNLHTHLYQNYLKGMRDDLPLVGWCNEVTFPFVGVALGDQIDREELFYNYDWMKDFTFLDFAREVGKHITVNYMMAKDSVQKRLNGEARDGLSFTEFTYQLLQGYDFLYLNEHKNCKLQMGGSDQWGNITTGAELIRRTSGNEVYALTCPLITKADGGKFGKTESGNVWLDPRYTSPYKFYQFWLNVSDDDAAKYIKIFTAIGREEIEALIAEHAEAPHMRTLQKRLAKEVTIMVHSEADYEAAVEASGILFGNNTHDALVKLDEDTLLAVFDGVPQFKVSRAKIEAGVKAVDLFVEDSAVFPSKGEMRKMAQGGGVSLNKEKLAAFDQEITTADLLNDKYLLVQRGKKNYFLLIAE